MVTKNSLIISTFLLIVTISLQAPPITSWPVIDKGGKWVLLQTSIGISAMHMQLLYTNRVVIFDRTDFGPSNLSLPFGQCRIDPKDVALTTDCTAHSLVYDIGTNTIRPLMVQTDTWCSSGAVLPSGTLVQTGGYNDGDRVVRTFAPCIDDFCDWVELPEYLSVRRWYASNQVLPDGRIIVVGGRRVFSYEFYPRSSTSTSTASSCYLRFLQETRDSYDENNLYPFLHLLPDGNLFVFANKRSILLDYARNIVVKEYPVMPGMDKRNYPSTGSSALLPLRLLSGNNETRVLAELEVEVMVCGGAPVDAFFHAAHGVFLGASSSCGRLKVSDPNADWVMEKMPMGRVMSDMLMLPTGDIIMINGAGNGTAGWEYAVNPVLNPVLYSTYERNLTRRFTVLNPSPIPRLYHSAAVLLPDGRVLVGGSNPHRLYNFTDVLYPTDLSLEAFLPPYLAQRHSDLRPTIVSHTGMSLLYRRYFTLTFLVPAYQPENSVTVTLLAPSFTTHSLAMNQRLLELNVVSFLQMATSAYQVTVVGPPTADIAPPGYYLMFIIHAGIPSPGVWVKVE